MKRQIPIGKKVGSAIYVLRDYADQIILNSTWADAIDIGLINYFNFHVVKWDSKKNKISFIYCPCFNYHEEPEVEAVVTVDLNKKSSRERNYTDGTIPAKNPPIYHHKWLMVHDEYPCFDVSSAKKRSEKIEEVIKKHRIDKKKIGYKKYWEENVLPLL